MRKTTIALLLATFFGNMAFSQTDEFVMTWAIVEAEAKKSDAEITNPKKAQNVKVWTERGRKYLEVYNFDAKDVWYQGLTKDEVSMVMNQVKLPLKSENTSGDTTILSFDRMTFYMVNNTVVRYERAGRAKEFFFPTHLAAVDVAAEAYIKANQLDVDGKRASLIAEQSDKLISIYKDKEATFFIGAKNYKLAADCYEKASNIFLNGRSNMTDSAKVATLKNTGELFKASEDYTKALFYYNAMLQFDKNQSPASFAPIYFCNLQMKDTAAAITTLEMVLEKFPSDPQIGDYINQLISIYMQTNQTDKAINYLEKGLSNDPNNTAYLFNLGVLNASQGKKDVAMDYYNKVLAIDPQNADANLNIGVSYVEQASETLKEADKQYGKKTYAGLKAKGQDQLKQAIPYVEIVAENSTDLGTRKNAYKQLMSIYMQLSMMDKYKAAKAKYDSI